MKKSSLLKVVVLFLSFSPAALASDEETDFVKIQSSVENVVDYGSPKEAPLGSGYFVFHEIKKWKSKYCSKYYNASLPEGCTQVQKDKVLQVLDGLKSKLYSILDTSSPVSDQIRNDRQALHSQVQLLLREVSPKVTSDTLNPQSLSHHDIQNITRYLIIPLLDSPDLNGLASSCRTMAALSKDVLAKRRQIEDLVGPMVLLEKGAFISGLVLDEQNLRNIGSSNPIIQIKKDFKMAVFPVTQERYEQEMGPGYSEKGGSFIEFMYPGGFPANMDADLIADLRAEYSNLKFNDKGRRTGKNLPMTLLTRAEEDAYIAKINQKVSSLWQIAYPGRKLPKVRKPTEQEWEYATTVPLAADQIETVVIPGNGEGIQVTAIQRLFPGADKGSDLPESRLIQEGPYSVDAPELWPNERGIRGLARGVFEVTSTVYTEDLAQPADAAVGTEVVIRASFWCSPDKHCRSTQRGKTGLEDRSDKTGLRLVMDLE